MKSGDIIKHLEELAPLRYAEAWDNCGLLTGAYDQEVDSVYLALDGTREVIREAEECGAGMLITHHPLIFSPLKRVVAEDYPGQKLIRLIAAGICCYAMHTNFDVACMAKEAARLIGLRDLKILMECPAEGEAAGLGRVGELPKRMTPEELCRHVKQVFSLETVRLFGGRDGLISRAAIMPGSGRLAIHRAMELGAQVLITGDIGHHEGLDAADQGLMILDAGHYGIEQIFVPYMQDYFHKNLPELKVYAENGKNPFRVI